MTGKWDCAHCFLKIADAPGESADDAHADEIEVQSWSWSETQSGTAGHGGGQGAGKVLPQDLNIVKYVDKSSPVLFISCATGKVFPDAVLTQRKAGEGQQDFLIITMSGVMVSTYEINGTGDGGVVPTESVSLNFQKLELSYAPQDEAGALGGEVKQGYDFVKNVKM